MEPLTRKINLAGKTGEEARELLRREWLLTNGLGGYASGTISGSVTSRHHGLLIAALPAPFGRMMMFNHLSEYLRFPDGRTIQIAGEEPSHPERSPVSSHYLTEFRLERQLPVWRFDVDGVVVEKRVLLVHGQNTVHITYVLLSNQQDMRIDLRPSFHFRNHEHAVNEPLHEKYEISISENRYEVRASDDLPTLRLMTFDGEPSFTHKVETRHEIFYLRESERGYASRGQLWSPGYFTLNLVTGKLSTLVASTEPWNIALALDPAGAVGAEEERRRSLLAMAHPKAQSGFAAELVLAADQFMMTPAGRVEDTARARAAGDEIRSVIAGYHWFTDWGRDTMISLEGLTLPTGRHAEGEWILRTFAHYIRHGLIPNFFPDGKNEGLYHTADATLWFFHALDRYMQVTGDRATLKVILPRLIDVAEHHLRGTHYGIGVDPADGLLRQGQQGYQLTWMDAKVDDWVVTPRRGKAVEINALWYNALRLLEGWLKEEGDDAAGRRFGEQAQRVHDCFNERFWFAQGGYLYDIVDAETGGNDSACRPNQVFAISLKHPVLDHKYWKPVLQVVKEKLVTPVGLRSLSREHPDYKAKYFGDLRARDAAYHQGTVWAWLIGPFIDAWVKTFPEQRAEARKLLEGFVPHLDEACVGSISEIFDAEAPFMPRGCIAQAWSVAEVLRCWVKTAE